MADQSEQVEMAARGNSAPPSCDELPDRFGAAAAAIVDAARAGRAEAAVVGEAVGEIRPLTRSTRGLRRWRGRR